MGAVALVITIVDVEQDEFNYASNPPCKAERWPTIADANQFAYGTVPTLHPPLCGIHDTLGGKSPATRTAICRRAERPIACFGPTHLGRCDRSALIDLCSLREIGGFPKVAEFLATGETTNAAAKKFRVTVSRISHIRRKLMGSWEVFQCERCCEVAKKLCGIVNCSFPRQLRSRQGCSPGKPATGRGDR